MSRAWKLIVLTLLALALFSSCSEDNGTNPAQTSDPTVPTVTTAVVSSIASTTAEGGGTVTSDGGDSVTARGICWSTNATPTLTDSHTSDGTGAGNFTSSLTGLTAGTDYYVRAYATNSVGTGYGSAQSFSTVSLTGTVTDIDGNVYQTIVIGTQVWMAENLKVTHYRNGDPIPNHLNGMTWDALTTGAYGEFDNSSDSAEIYGRLYNWYAADDSRIIAPEGWHIPSHTEWTTLGSYLGVDAGAKMRETGTAHWFSPNANATNESGFTALGAGLRGYQGQYVGLHQYAFFWTSTEYDINDAYSVQIDIGNDYLYRGGHPSMATGYSIRCIKD